MCLNPITIKNKSKYVNLHGSQYLVQVPCGKCAECREMKYRDYAVRSYYEFLEAEDKGGFGYFETLTYNDENVPCVYDEYDNLLFLCFDRKDVTDFLKRLRVNLERAGYDVKDNLTYFLVSEYGGKTMRPHYHVIFYVKFNISVRAFASFVYAAWDKGFTNMHFPGDYSIVDGKKIEGTGAIHYVAKYVNKDCDWMDVIESNEDTLRQISDKEYDNLLLEYNLTGQSFKHPLVKKVVKPDELEGEYFESYNKLYTKDEWYKGKTRCVSPFHRQSHGFGTYMIKVNDYDFMFEEGLVQMPDKQKGQIFLPIPMYIIRKLWYDVRYDSNGTLYWILTEEGKKWKQRRLEKSVDLYYDKLKEIYENYDLITKNTESESINKKHIDEILNGRSLYDYAMYMVYYKGRLLDKEFRNNVPDIYYMIDNSCMDVRDSWMYGYKLYRNHMDDDCPHLMQDGAKWYYENYVVDKEEYYLKRWVEHGDESAQYQLNMWYEQYRNAFISKDNLIELYLVDENYDEKFEGYDNLTALFDYARRIIDDGKNRAYFEAEEIKSRLKLVNKFYHK